jgi:predicted PhzF superfamily epimerase YddE/YHI9
MMITGETEIFGFSTQLGAPEGHVTGSAHCVLGPYWSQRLGKDVLSARQCSPRGGELALHVFRGLPGDERVVVSGDAVVIKGVVCL